MSSLASGWAAKKREFDRQVEELSDKLFTESERECPSFVTKSGGRTTVAQVIDHPERGLRCSLASAGAITPEQAIALARWLLDTFEETP